MPSKVKKKDTIVLYKEALESGQFDDLIESIKNSLAADRKFINKTFNSDRDKVLNLLCAIPLNKYSEPEGNKILNFIEVLLDEHNADMTSANKLGDTPLHDAIRAGNDQTVKLLLNYEDSSTILDAENSGGFSPLGLAVHYKYPTIEKMLLQEANSLNIPESMTMAEFQRYRKQQLINQGGISKLSDKEEILSNTVDIIESVIYTDDESVAKDLAGKLDEIYDNPTMKPLLDMMAFAALGLHKVQPVFQIVSQQDSEEESRKHFKIFLPGELSSLKYRVSDADTLGMYTMKNSVFISTLDDPSERIKRHPDEIMSLILHESAHFVSQQLFNNKTIPFSTKDDVEKSIYKDMFNQTMRRLSNMNIKNITDPDLFKTASIISNVRRYPSEENQLAELIVRVPEIIGALGHEKGRAQLEMHFPELLNYYENHFNHAITKYLKESEQLLLPKEEKISSTASSSTDRVTRARSIFAAPANDEAFPDVSKHTSSFNKNKPG